jgi:phage recombination protein Bet
MNAVAQLPQTVARAWTGRQLDTIKRTVASDTNEDEFSLFIEYARVKHLDPFSKQVIAVVFSKDDAKKRRMSIIVTQDGQRVLASRCRDYRPAEDVPEFTYNADMKGPTNPLGIECCTVTLWKQDNQSTWHPVKGWAFWEEYAPVKTSNAAYDWVETGEVYPDSGKPKKRRQLKEGADLAKFQTLDESGNWAKMPRVMIAKCATMVALRAGWPETFDGVYGEEELDRQRAADLTASEMVEQEREVRRMKSIAMSDDEFPFVGADGSLSFLAAGRYGDHILMNVRNCTELSELDAMQSRNREGLQRFWAKHKDDALHVRKKMDEIRSELARKG